MRELIEVRTLIGFTSYIEESLNTTTIMGIEYYEYPMNTYINILKTIRVPNKFYIEVLDNDDVFEVDVLVKYKSKYTTELNQTKFKDRTLLSFRSDYDSITQKPIKLNIELIEYKYKMKNFI